MNCALTDRLLSLLPEVYNRSFIAQQLTRNPKMTFLEVFNGVLQPVWHRHRRRNHRKHGKVVGQLVATQRDGKTYQPLRQERHLRLLCRTSNRQQHDCYICTSSRSSRKQESTSARTKTGSPATTTTRPGRTSRISGGLSTSSYAAPTPPRFSTNLGATQHRIRVRTSVTWQICWKIARIN